MAAMVKKTAMASAASVRSEKENRATAAHAATTRAAVTWFGVIKTPENRSKGPANACGKSLCRSRLQRAGPHGRQKHAAGQPTNCAVGSIFSRLQLPVLDRASAT